MRPRRSLTVRGSKKTFQLFFNIEKSIDSTANTHVNIIEVNRQQSFKTKIGHVLDVFNRVLLVRGQKVKW